MAMKRDFSSYVITDPCIGVKDGTCVEVCPVDCIESGDEYPQFFIDPELCIACEQCVLVCPVDAIYLEHAVPEQWRDAIQRNAAFFLKSQASAPLVDRDEALQIMRRAAARAAELSLHVAIAVVDREGVEVALDVVGEPVEGARALAANKAYTSAMLERSTADLNERVLGNVGDGVDKGRLSAEAGGIPFGRPYVIAGLGVSGATPEQDHECARAALAP